MWLATISWGALFSVALGVIDAADEVVDVVVVDEVDCVAAVIVVVAVVVVAAVTSSNGEDERGKGSVGGVMDTRRSSAARRLSGNSEFRVLSKSTPSPKSTLSVSVRDSISS
jgi:hypothetical protein